ncbi:DUF1275 domain protein [Xylogone sp. PMI_703]|nr:DUF1275 domain protein [Xylogone sp. PMI_703]
MAKSKSKLQIRSYLDANIREDALLEAELLLLAFATGIQDATTFPDYHCFASNQTGNTVLLAVGVTGVGNSFFSLRDVGISLATFVAGVAIMGGLGNWAGPRRRSWLVASSIVQTAMVFAASALQYHHGVAKTNDGYSLGVITLLAFSSGGQVAMVRALHMTEITTAMATAAYIDLFIDTNLFQRHNRSRNRRILFLACLFAGSFAGAFSYARIGSAFALLISAIGKLLATAGFLFNSEIKERDDKIDEESSLPVELWQK